MMSSTLARPRPHPAMVAAPEPGLFWLLLFCSWVVAWYLQVGYRIEWLGDIRFELVTAILLSAAALAQGARWGQPTMIMTYVFLAIILVQLPFSFDPVVSWDRFLDRVAKFACFALMIPAFCKGRRSLSFFIGAYLLAFLRMGYEALIGNVTGSLIWENQGVMRLHGSTPIYAHPNSLAGTMLGTLPFVIYLWSVSKTWVRVVLAVQVVFVVNALLFSGSRTGYVGFVALVVYVVWNSRHRVRTALITAVVALCLFPLIPHDYVERFGSIFTGKDKEGESTDTRKVILQDAWATFQKYPLGIGVAAFPAVRTHLFGRVQDTHNLYLEVGTNLGVQGLIVFGLWVGTMWLALSRTKRFGRELLAKIGARLKLLDGDAPARETLVRLQGDVSLYVAVAQATLAFLFVRLVLGLFGHDLYEVYWWFAVGLATSLLTLMEISRAAYQHLAPAEAVEVGTKLVGKGKR
ncbi:MAG: O-antigen ligase family protein [Acidobacteriota bacterium]